MILYLEIELDWVAEMPGDPAVKAKLVPPGHITVTSADDTGDRIRRLVAKCEARFGSGVWDRLRKTRPDTPEVGFYNADNNSLTWAS